ncbi:30S ribosomal protein S16 [bacterium BMS3Abin01]|nr:30S ribosomal protein S16 [bacterium BMS3Abin01]
MSVKIRLSRVGRNKTPIYRIVVADSRSPRDGRIIENIGRYDPRKEPSLIEIDEEKARDWIGKGAQPSATVAKLLEVKGIS